MQIPEHTPLDGVGAIDAGPPRLRHLGLTDYEAVRLAMKAFTEQRDASTPDEIWVTQHHPVYTLGLAGRTEHVRDPGPIPVIRSDRGGQVTYHGPGQLVVYPLLDLRRYGLRVREYVHLLEAVLIASLVSLGVSAACRKPGAPGVYLPWVSAEGGLAKIAALGIKVTRGCSWHGMALNVDMDLTPFHGINPCGYEGMLTLDLATVGVRMDVDAVGRCVTDRLLYQLANARSAQAD